MRKYQRIKNVCLLYVIVHFSFMLLYTPLFGGFDFFPLFTWNIFRPYPDTPVKHTILVVTEVNGQKLEKPGEVEDIDEAFFSNIQFYDFTHRLVRLGQSFRNKEVVKDYVHQIEKDLLVMNSSVKYEIHRIKIDPIQYKVRGQVLDREVLVTGFASKDKEQ